MCVDDCIRDDEGKDRICPHCLDDLATCLYDSLNLHNFCYLNLNDSIVIDYHCAY